VLTAVRIWGQNLNYPFQHPRLWKDSTQHVASADDDHWDSSDEMEVPLLLTGPLLIVSGEYRHLVMQVTRRDELSLPQNCVCLLLNGEEGVACWGMGVDLVDVYC